MARNNSGSTAEERELFKSWIKQRGSWVSFVDYYRANRAPDNWKHTVDQYLAETSPKDFLQKAFPFEHTLKPDEWKRANKEWQMRLLAQALDDPANEDTTIVHDGPYVKHMCLA